MVMAVKPIAKKETFSPLVTRSKPEKNASLYDEILTITYDGPKMSMI